MTYKMAVWRSRNSNGHVQIGIEYDGKRIEFNLPTEYENHARTLAVMLDKVCDNPCLLPEQSK